MSNMIWLYLFPVGLAVLVIALLAVALASVAARMNEPATPSADDWWQDAERIKAAVEAAHKEGIERAVLPKMED